MGHVKSVGAERETFGECGKTGREEKVVPHGALRDRRLFVLFDLRLL